MTSDLFDLIIVTEGFLKSWNWCPTFPMKIMYICDINQEITDLDPFLVAILKEPVSDGIEAMGRNQGAVVVGGWVVVPEPLAVSGVVPSVEAEDWV